MAAPEDRLLLVEDDDFLAQCLRRRLEGAGYGVAYRDCGLEAIEYLDRHAHNTWWLVTDINCGDRVSGWEIARHARRLNPRVAVLYMTGDAAPDWRSEAVARSALIEKPFDVPALLSKLEQLGGWWRTASA